MLIYVIIDNMRTLSIAISDFEYKRFGITNNIIPFSDFVDMVSKELMKKTMKETVNSAQLSGLSAMTMEDITKEVQAVRLNAKNYN